MKKDLLVQWEEALESGNELPVSELCTDYPHLTTEVERPIKLLRTTAWTKQDPARPMDGERGGAERDLSGTLLSDRYHLESLIGSGGYGQVYRGLDTKLQRQATDSSPHCKKQALGSA